MRFRQVDVFARVPFRGNPVAVVLDGEGLDAAAMQRIAAWTNLSETTFVLPPGSAAADYRLRIFTPRAELPFAGHPTIGSAHAVLEAGIFGLRGPVLRQECGAGILDLSVLDERIWVKAPSANIVAFPRERLKELEQALGAPAAGAPMIVHVGPVWLVADLGPASIVDGLSPDMNRVSALSIALGITGITVFGAASGEAAIHVRSFAPAHGIAEDPVCGSGNISVAAYLARAGCPFGTSWTARQGMQLGRDGRVSMRISGDEIFLGGHAVTCVEGTLHAASR